MSYTISQIQNKLVEEGYTEKEIKPLLKQFLEADKELYGVISQWLRGEELDPIEVEGYSLKDLQIGFGMNTVASILTLDWLKKDPLSAQKIIKQGIK